MATQPNWWENDPLVTPANDPGFTGVIPGVVKPAKPYEPPSGYTGSPQSLKPIPGGPADKTAASADPKLRESEQKAAFLTTNLVGNVNLIADAVRQDKSAAAPTWGQVASGLLGQDVKNAMLPDQRQVVENAQRMVVDAALTLGTGAAYTKEQIEAYRRGFFPQVGDSPAAIEAKRQSLRTAMMAARMNAGSAAPQIDQAMAALGLSGDPLADGPKAAGSGSEPPPGVGELTPEQQERDKAFLATNPTPEQYAAFLATLIGGPVDSSAAKKRLEAAKSGQYRYSGATVDPAYQERVRQAAAKGDDPVTTLVGSGATLGLADEAAGVGNAAASLLTGKFDPITSYRVGRDAERMRIANAREQLGYGGTALEIAGGFMSANPAAALAPFTTVRGLIGQGARAGAYGGALAGFGTGEGLEDSATKALLGGAAGAAVGAGISGISARYAPRGMAPELARASEAEGVDLLRPMVDPNAIGEYGALESNVYSQPIIRGAAARVRGQVEDRVEGLAPGGTPLEEGSAGERLQVASNRYITRSRGIKDRLYRRAENLAGDTRFAPEKALAQVDQEIAQLSGNEGSNAAEIAFLQTIRGDLAKAEGKTVGEIRNIREGLRGELGRQNLTLSGAEARALRVMDAAADDIADKVPAAASAYRRADNFYRERMVMVDDIKRAILGKKDDPLDPQKAFANIKSLASPNANGRRLAAVMRNLEPDERQDVAATVAQSLGRRSADEPFSTALFLSQSRKLSPSARRTIFGPDGAESINNLRLLAQKLEAAEKDINRSRSASTLERQGWRQAARTFIASVAGIGGTAATGSVAGGIAGAGVAAGAMGLSAARRVLSARAMVNPRVSRWLAQAADVSTPAQAQQTVRRLGTIISREPALAGELQPIHNFLTQRLAPAMASGPETKDQDDDQR